MIKMHYPEGELLNKLKKDFKATIDYEVLKSKWEPYRSKYRVEIETLIVGPFEDLVDAYLKFNSVLAHLSETEQTKERDDLKGIFDYGTLQPKIAALFMDSKYGWRIKTCHYCNTSYINAYGWKGSYENVLGFINNATQDEWRRLFTVEQLPNEKLSLIIANSPFESVEKFDEGHYLARRIESYKSIQIEVDANQFDLDHVLPKGKCPIVGLSLFNLVPSCSICNEKLKGEKELAQTKEDWLKLSPTYSEYQWENDVQIHLVPTSSSSTFFTKDKNKDLYRLEFDTHGNKAYEREIGIFRLVDRYNFHKDLALRILDLKERYTEEKIKELSRLLNYSKEQIKEDIFALDFSRDRCFGKLRKDIIELG